jgi:HAD superfamily phosphatase (TIGR01681 family)
MFEFDQYDATLHAAKPVLNGAGTYNPSTNIASMSFLVWGEHCIECAAPDCFSSCTLYRPRSDGYCRRLAYGMYRNENFNSPHGYGAEIIFKKWGKIEARGNTNMEPLNRILRRERAASLIVPALSTAGNIVSRVIGYRRFKRVSSSLLEKYQRWKHRRKPAQQLPSAFLLEVYNPAEEPVSIQVSMGPAVCEIVDADRTKLPPPFRATLAIEPGYSRHEIDQVSFRAITESGLPFDIAIMPEGDNSVHLVFLTADFVTYNEVATDAPSTKQVKCVVFDLDGTVWNGILLENENVELADNLVETLEKLDERGILLSVASKNSHEHAWKKLEKLGIAEYFLYPEINWRPKSENIRRIANNLNIGIDSLAFIDDNEFELEEVRSVLPQVTCFEHTALRREIAAVSIRRRLSARTSWNPTERTTWVFWRAAA